MISVWKGTDPNNLVFYKDLTHPDSSVVELIQEFDASYGFIDNEGTKFWFRTDLDAPKGRLIAIDLTQPAPDQWQEIIPEREDTLEGVGILNHQFVADYLKDAYTNIRIYSLEGELRAGCGTPRHWLGGGLRR